MTRPADTWRKAEARGEIPDLPRVPLPVDVSNETLFPNIAAARRWVREKGVK